MLTIPEKVLFTLFALATAVAIYRVSDRIWRTIRRGQGEIKLDDLPRRLWETGFKTLTFERVFRFRLGPSFFHGLVAWAFLFYLIVNIGDGLEGFFAELVFLGAGNRAAPGRAGYGRSGGEIPPLGPAFRDVAGK